MPYLDDDGESLVGEHDRRIIAMGAFRPADGYVPEVLDTMPRQTGARRFYETNGFETVRRERLRYDGTCFDLLFSRKSLSGAD